MTAKDARENLGRTIRRFRESLGLSRDAYADRCGLSLSAVKNAECGSDLRFDTLVRLAGGLDLSLNELLDSVDPSAAETSVKLRTLGLRIGGLDEDEQDLVHALVRVLAKWAKRMVPEPAT